MEECKWIMVRRETTYCKIKRHIKNFFFRLFGLEEVKNVNKSLPASNKRENGEIIIEIVV